MTQEMIPLSVRFHALLAVLSVLLLCSAGAAFVLSANGGAPPAVAAPNCSKKPDIKPCQTTAPTTAPTTPTTAPTTATTAPSTATTAPTTTPPTSCTNPVIIGEGAGRTFGEYYVHNNNWNDNYGGTHTIEACSADLWTGIANVPNHSDNAVEAYLNVHKDYDNRALSTIQSVDFAGVGPKCAGCIYNLAFDIWVGQGLTHELMIWTENWGQRPAGNQVGTINVGGFNYSIWRSGSGDGGIITYLSAVDQPSGNMPLQPFFADARTRGWTPTTTWQVDFGVETVDTNGTTQRFTFTKFDIHD